MSKYEFKQLVVFIILSIINMCIAYLITTSLGIQNVVLYQTYTAMQHTITYEILIWFALSIISASICDNKFETQG